MDSFPYLKNLKQAYFQVTNKCNLACGYCYAIEKNCLTRVLYEQKYKEIIDGIAKHSLSKHIEIIFHGGEPLLAKYRFYETCLKYAKEIFSAYGKIVDFGIQTNLTLMTTELLDLFENYSVSISSSIDGPERVHNTARQQWNNTIKWLIEIRRRNMKVSPIVVCSKHNVEYVEDIFQLFDNCDIRRFQLNIATSNYKFAPHTSFLPLTSEEILSVYKNTVNCSFKYKMSEEKVTHMVRRFIGFSKNYMTALGCENPFCHAGSTMIVFTPNGEMFPCSPCVSLAINGPNFMIGHFGEHMSTDNYFDILAKFHQKGQKYLEECPNCPASIICEYNCPGFDRIDEVTRNNKCHAIKEFFLWLKGVNRNVLECVAEIR